ncbi:Pectinesterase inhibitor domain containing protein [Parasponia andersonii]|uniref:Pectinesterase inhibitor domain containing protein n=1 Tax=Parasponia andersonii TaxID=3476 RepID=A0A2P5B1F3_PARAD|nr:Pectinesterase inhibitor domain containing protein [Parasponia andersonii]
MNPISIFCFVTLLSFCFHQIPLVESSDDLITQTCSKTLYKDLCEKTLRADPGSKGAKVEGLAKIALKAAASNAKTIQSQIASLLKTTSDKQVKEALEDCSDNYDGASEQLSDSLGALEAKRYADVNVWVTAAMTDGDSCEEGFESGTSPLTQANTNFGHLTSNVLAITNQLKA